VIYVLASVRPPWRAAFATNHIIEPEAHKLSPPNPRYEKGGKGIPPARMKSPNQFAVIGKYLDKEKLLGVVAAAIAIETYELNLEE
jgi:hypothetical protein